MFVLPDNAAAFYFLFKHIDAAKKHSGAKLLSSLQFQPQLKENILTDLFCFCQTPAKVWSRLHTELLNVVEFGCVGAEKKCGCGNKCGCGKKCGCGLHNLRL